MIRRIVGLPVRVLKRALSALDGERGAPSPAPPMEPIATPKPSVENVEPKKAAPKKTSAPKKAAPKKTAPKKAAPKKTAPKKTAPKKVDPPTVTVEAQETPNPNAMKFVLSVKVAETGSFSFNATDTDIEHPIAAAVVALEGVVSIFGVNDFVTISKSDDAEWRTLLPIIVDAIKGAA